MAALSTEDRAEILRKIAQDASGSFEAMNLTRSQALAVTVAIDDYIEVNQAAFNSALPQPGRGTLTAKQKANWYARVLQQKFERS